MSQVSHPKPSVLRQNIEVVKLFVERWHAVMTAKRDVILALLSRERSAERLVGVQLLGVLVSNKIPAFEVTDSSVVINETAFFQKLGDCLTADSKPLYEASARVRSGGLCRSPILICSSCLG